MEHYERFGDCLKRCLQEAELSASEAARLVNFRSRNSIFRILAGDASPDVSLRFLSALHDALGDKWPHERWHALQEALSVERLGEVGYRSRHAFEQVLYGTPAPFDAVVEKMNPDDSEEFFTLSSLLDTVCASPQAEIIITGCCDSGLSHLLAERCAKAGAEGRLKIRHYIYAAEDCVTQNILGVLPLVSMPWFNARLVRPDDCPEETVALYCMHALHILYQAEDGTRGGMFVRMDREHFASRMVTRGAIDFIRVLDKYRFDLELLKPFPKMDAGAEAFVEFTETYRELESDCLICSIKPDVHFNLLPAAVLESAVRDGFQQAGIADGDDLETLITVLKDIHLRRLDNMLTKRKPTHIIYSLPAMERFMRTGVQTDHFFIQRAYTVEERRTIIRLLLDTMQHNPWFNVYFLKDIAPELRYEIGMYGDKGVLLTDAFTGYALQDDHSDALITLPSFIHSFRTFFMDELLAHHVLSRAENIQMLEHLISMDIQD